MKLKYYLRGLGIGIICTAIIMGIALSGNKKETLTDAEIIERAKLLGMVMEEGTKESSEQEPEDKQKEPEQKSLESPEPKDNQTEGNNSGEDTPSENDDTKKASETDKPEDESSSQGTESKEDPKKDEDAAKETSSNPEAGQSSQQEASQDVVEIRIEEGDYSDLISRKLFQAGLITDASAFDNYLTKNGLDESLRIGVHKIPKGSTQEEIVEILQK
ncbi:MAG: hypothetical protein HFI71_08990 [Lachnospiraceae bacterium]|nr:hypothetical protein [Lachnospiraceae bacterium]